MDVQKGVDKLQTEVKKKMTIETKLLVGFIFLYIGSPVVPGLVTVLIDFYFQDGLISDAMIGLITFIALLLFIVIVANYLMKWITQPVRKLITAAEKMANGDLDVDLEVESSTELLIIASSLSRMKSSLKISYDWLGPPELVKFEEKKEILGISLNQKIMLGMVIFLILNPLVAGLSHTIFPDQASISSIISIVFSIILLSLIANYLYQQIIKPLAEVAKKAEKVSLGDFSEPFEVRYTGDIGHLEHNFKQISERVQRAMQELGMNE